MPVGIHGLNLNGAYESASVGGWGGEDGALLGGSGSLGIGIIGREGGKNYNAVAILLKR